MTRSANSLTDLKRELISQQTKYEIGELNTPTALQRFGAPFRSDAGEVAPEDSELPLLRYIFVHHVRNFPFLDKAKEKEFWQNKLQVVSQLRILGRKRAALIGDIPSSSSPSQAKISHHLRTVWRRRNGESWL